MLTVFITNHTQAGIKFPSALAGMFGVVAVLCIVGDKAADKILGLYGPALSWIARWLPLFCECKPAQEAAAKASLPVPRQLLKGMPSG